MANEKRLIDANAFYSYLEDLRQDYIAEDSLSSNFAADVIETVQDVYLANAPSVDAVEVVHGRWVHVPSSDMMTGKAYKCSKCNKMRYGSFMPNYCQNCGAKMDK